MNSKLLKASISLMLILNMVFLSCSKDEDPSKIKDDNPGAFVATIDGETIDFRYQPLAYHSTYNDIPAMSLSGRTPSVSDGYNGELSITLVNFDGARTYELGGSNLSNAHYSFFIAEGGGGSGTSYYIGQTSTAEGVVNVTSYSGNNIKGSFSFDAYNFNDDHTITINGTFDLDVND